MRTHCAAAAAPCSFPLQQPRRSLPPCLPLPSELDPRSFYFHLHSQFCVQFSFFLYHFLAMRSPQATCNSMFFLINIYFFVICFSKRLCLLFLYLYFFLFLEFHCHTWSQHFLTFLGMCHPHTLSTHLSQWDLGNYYGPPSACSQKNKNKKTTSNPYFSHNGPNSPSPGQAVPHCSKLAGGVGGDGVRGWGASN